MCLAGLNTKSEELPVCTMTKYFVYFSFGISKTNARRVARTSVFKVMFLVECLAFHVRSSETSDPALPRDAPAMWAQPSAGIAAPTPVSNTTN